MKNLFATFVLLIAMSTTASCATSPESPLHRAAATGDVAVIRKLVADGAELDARDAAQRTPLLRATHGNHVAAAKVLREQYQQPRPTLDPHEGLARDLTDYDRAFGLIGDGEVA